MVITTMKNSPTNLSFLMRELNITGAELARALDVDTSLVSKWKSNSRPLTLSSSYIDKLSDYLLRKDGNNNIRYIFIKELLAGYFKSTPDIGIHEKLKIWLVSKYESTAEISMQKIRSPRLMQHATKKRSLIFTGNNGRREAVRDFFETALENPRNKNVTITTQEDLSWMTEDTVFLNEWLTNLESLLKKGATINHIYFIDRTIPDLSFIFVKYLHLYLYDNMKGYFYPKYGTTTIKNTIMLLKDQLGIIGMQGPDYNKRFSELFCDEKSLTHYNWVTQNLITVCKPLYRKIKFSELGQLFSNVQTRNINESSYSLLTMKVPGFYTISEDLFETLIEKGDFSPDEKVNLKQFYLKSRKTYKPKRQIYSAKETRKILNKKYFSYQDINKIVNREVKIPRDFFLKHLIALYMEQKDSPDLEIGFTDEDIPVNIYIIDENFFLIWDGNKNSNYCIFNELNLTSAMYYHYVKVWGNIPSIYKDSNFFKEKLNELKADVN